ERLHRGPAECLADTEADADGGEHLDVAADEGDGADAQHVAEGELDADGEHQQDDADLGELLDGEFVDFDAGNIWSEDEPGEDVAKDERLAEGSSNKGPHAGGGEREDKSDEKVGFVYLFAPRRQA